MAPVESKKSQKYELLSAGLINAVSCLPVVFENICCLRGLAPMRADLFPIARRLCFQFPSQIPRALYEKLQSDLAFLTGDKNSPISRYARRGPYFCTLISHLRTTNPRSTSTHTRYQQKPARNPYYVNNISARPFAYVEIVVDGGHPH